MLYTFEGIPINIVWRSNSTRICLSVTHPDARVRLTVPIKCKVEEILTFLTSKKAWLETARKKVLDAASNTAAAPPPDKEAIKSFIKTAKERLDYWQQKTGLTSSGVSFSSMRSRWGTYNIKTNKIRLSLMLINKPPECLDYIIVHELTHILSPRHDNTFYQHLTKFYPDWKSVRRKLR